MSKAKQLVERMDEAEVKNVLRREYMRKLTRYKFLDELYRKKYGMNFEEFEKKNIVAKRNYTWEVESDSQNWEMAIDGIHTMLRKLKEIGI